MDTFDDTHEIAEKLKSDAMVRNDTYKYFMVDTQNRIIRHLEQMCPEHSHRLSIVETKISGAFAKVGAAWWIISIAAGIFASLAATLIMLYKKG